MRLAIGDLSGIAAERTEPTNTRRMKLLALMGATVLAFGVAAGSAAYAAKINPVGFELCTPEGPAAVDKCNAVGTPATYTVPANRRLIIEQVSGDCGGDAQAGLPFTAGVIAQTAGVVVEHTIIGVPHSAAPGGLIALTATRIYADPGSTVTLGLTGVPSVEGRFCRIAFSGQLVKP